MDHPIDAAGAETQALAVASIRAEYPSQHFILLLIFLEIGWSSTQIGFHQNFLTA